MKMMNSKQEVTGFNSEMLTLARESRGMNQSTLASLLSVSQSRISKIELGVASCDAELLTRIISVLNYPESFFLQARRLMGLPISVHGLYRKRTAIKKLDLSKIQAFMNLFTYHIEDLTKTVNIRPKYALPIMPIDEFKSPSEVAQLARRAMLVPDGPIKNLVSIIEGAGIIVIKRPFDTEQIDGLSLLVNGIPPLIFIREGMPGDRELMTLAHELGHLIMHYSGSISNDMEDEAFEFAAEFLMPAKEIRSQLRDLSFSKLAALKTHWRVSMQALLYRAKKLGAITESRYKSLVVQLSAAGYRKNEPIEIEAPSPKLLDQLIQTYFNNLKYTKEELAKALHLFVDDLAIMYLHQKPLRLLKNNLSIVPDEQTYISPAF